MNYNKEKMSNDIKVTKEDNETLCVELNTLSRIETFYLTRKTMFLKNVYFPKYFDKRLITWDYLLSLNNK